MHASHTRIHTHPRICTRKLVSVASLQNLSCMCVCARTHAHTHTHSRAKERQRWRKSMCVGIHTRTHTYTPYSRHSKTLVSAASFQNCPTCVCVREKTSMCVCMHHAHAYIHTLESALEHTCPPRVLRTFHHCNTLQHTATHCNTLQHTATHCNTLQHTAACLEDFPPKHLNHSHCGYQRRFL